MQQKKIIQALVAIGCLSLLAACGGGGGSSATVTPTPSALKGTVSMAITDGPSDSFNHVWVTIKSIAFHTDAAAVWSATDATWQTTTLAAPITVDLAALNNGALNNVFANMSLPVGAYKQIRFFLASDSDALSASAMAIKDNEATPLALQWNDQVEYLNAAGVVSEAPLEMANPVQGLQLNGTFNVTSGGTLNLTTDFDLDKIIAPYQQDGVQAFTLRPVLHYFDLTKSGAISGKVDPTLLCQDERSLATTCAFKLIVHAETLSADGSRHVDVRSTSVDPVTGNFTLAPLPLVDSSSNPITYDIVVRGRQMETMLITGVTPAGSYSGATLSGATQLSPTALTPTMATEYGANLSSSLTPLTSGYVIFQQTLPIPGVTTPVPYEIRWTSTDPYTGLIYRAGLWDRDDNVNTGFMLSNSAVLVAPFNAGNALTFAEIVPNEGRGGYTVSANETSYYNLATLGTPIVAPLSGNSVSFTAPTPTLQANAVAGTISGNITISNATAYNAGMLVIARYGQIVTTVDISSLLSTGGGAFNVANIPSGSTTTPLPGANYYAYLRLWQSSGTSHAGHRAKIVPIAGMIDLTKTSSVTGMNVSVAAP